MTLGRNPEARGKMLGDLNKIAEQMEETIQELQRRQVDPRTVDRQRQILDIIDGSMRERGYPPSVREIGEKVGLTSPSTVHTHLASLQRLGFLRRDPTKPRAIEVRFDATSGAPVERRPVRHVPLVGDVAAGTDVLAQENVEELFPVPTDFTGEGDLFMLRVRGESMIEAGILDGDFVIAVQQPTAQRGQIIVAGIPGDEATVKTFQRKDGKVWLLPHNESYDPIDGTHATILGKVTAVLRRTRDTISPAPEVAVSKAVTGFADVEVHRNRRILLRAGTEVQLTHLEFELLCFFLDNPDQVLERDLLLRHVWGTSGSKRTVDNFVGQLRSKLEDDPENPRYFVTVRGSGYRFVP